jgi:tubulin polyglutamylase TTLL6/13
VILFLVQEINKMSQSNSALANAIANKQGANSKLSAANTKSKGNLGNK